MTIQIKVNSDIAERLAILAKLKGVSAEDLLRRALETIEDSQAAIDKITLQRFEKDMDALSEGLENLSFQYQGTYSRKDIYFDHD